MKLSFLLLFLSWIALADVGPRPLPCNVPAACTTCSMHMGDESVGGDCKAGAIDAGLIESECSDRHGSSVSRYFCPKGTTASRGCSSVDVMGLSALALLLVLRRRGR